MASGRMISGWSRAMSAVTASSRALSVRHNHLTWHAWTCSATGRRPCPHHRVGHKGGQVTRLAACAVCDHPRGRPWRGGARAEKLRPQGDLRTPPLRKCSCCRLPGSTGPSPWQRDAAGCSGAARHSAPLSASATVGGLPGLVVCEGEGDGARVAGLGAMCGCVEVGVHPQA
jgi:hypothetical protein